MSTARDDLARTWSGRHGGDLDLRLTDTCLRDGSHHKRHQFTTTEVRDIVAALIDGETTLKRYIVEGGRPYLKAENPEFPDLLPVQELVIQGVMIAMLRHARRD